MDTLRVNIVYRPLRIAWAIHSGDFDAYRRAVRYSHTLWGGRFNPIVFADRVEEACKLIDLFRADMVIAIGDSDIVKDFPKRYPYLINPFFNDDVFVIDNTYQHNWSHVLDVYNALIYLHDKPIWKEIKEEGVRLFTWQQDDPLADVFLTQFGNYPAVDEVGTDYRKIYLDASEGQEIELCPATPIPAETIKHPSISYLSRHGLQRHYSFSTRHNAPGFFVGCVTDLDDLVCNWNLRACDIPLWFIDLAHIDRYSALIPAWDRDMREMISNYRNERDRHVAVWTRQVDNEVEGTMFGTDNFLRHHVSDASWNRLDIMPPLMYLDEASVLGVISNDSGPKVSFALNDKPFSGDIFFHTQKLVASVSFIGGLYDNDQHAFRAPYLPELNEFYARSMHFEYNKLRVEPDRIGIVITVSDHDAFINALRVDALMEQIFGMAGYNAKLSAAGLLTRQLIARLGGLQGARVFKIPGVRKLLHSFGLEDSFFKGGALCLIGSKDPDNPDASFNDYKDLHIEPRPPGSKLTAVAVFGYLVEKGLYRIGAELLCPGCSMKSWIPLDSLNHHITCDLCGFGYDATRQLVDTDKWNYRRSGVMGVEKNSKGAVPVALTLQQLESSFHGRFDGDMYSPSLDLSPKDGNKPCEIDFVWIIPRAYPRRTVVIIGECKDKGPITNEDIDTLKHISDALPRKRFKTFVVLSQIVPFSAEQIEYAKTLNDKGHLRAILLTARELEPYFMYERTQKTTEVDISYESITPEGMAKVTQTVYFS